MVKVFVMKFDVAPWDRTHQVCLFTDASHVCRLVPSALMEDIIDLIR